MSDDWIIGDTAILSLDVTDAATGAALDAAAVTLKVQRPDGVIATPMSVGSGVTRTGIGLYQARLPLTQSGAWYARWEAQVGDDTVAHEPEPITVQRSRFTP